MNIYRENIEKELQIETEFISLLKEMQSTELFVEQVSSDEFNVNDFYGIEDTAVLTKTIYEEFSKYFPIDWVGILSSPNNAHLSHFVSLEHSFSNKASVSLEQAFSIPDFLLHALFDKRKGYFISDIQQFSAVGAYGSLLPALSLQQLRSVMFVPFTPTKGKNRWFLAFGSKQVGSEKREDCKKLVALSQEILQKVEKQIALQVICKTTPHLQEKMESVFNVFNKVFEELAVIGNIQHKLLPDPLPASKDYVVQSHYEPCECAGGDYFDIFKVGENYTVFVIADVSGHGTSAMVAMTIVRCFVRIIGRTSTSPASVLRQLHELLYQHCPTEHYVTMFYGIYDHEKKTMRYASAGHPSPLCYNSASKDVSELEIDYGFPLKTFDEEEGYHESEVELNEGNTLLLRTDGYEEAFNRCGEAFGNERTRQTFKRAAEITGGTSYLMKELKSFVQQKPYEDDIALVYIDFIDNAEVSMNSVEAVH